jgi:hypothetical protein
MRYSVWQGNRYAYFDAPGALEDGVFAPKAKLTSFNRIGVAPEEAARPLPSGAVLVGHGPTAQGLIATRKGVGLGALADSSVVTLAIGIGIAWLVWSHIGGK